jgi:hypothetical protein
MGSKIPTIRLGIWVPKFQAGQKPFEKFLTKFCMGDFKDGK